MNKSMVIVASVAFVVSGAIFFTVGWFSKPDDDDGDGATGVTAQQQVRSYGS